MSNAATTVISATTAASTKSYDSSSGDMTCALVFYAGPLAGSEQVQIAIAGSGGNCLLFQDGLQVVLSITNPIQQVSAGPNYVLIKPVTATACAVDVCRVGK